MISAFALLTTLPVPHQEQDSYPYAPLFFGVVGVFRGAVFYGVALLLSSFCEPTLLALILVFLEFLLSRGLHWDGLADTGDALGAGHKGREYALEVLKDPHVGVFGVFSLLLDLLLRLHTLPSLPLAFYFFYPLAGMIGILTPMIFLPYLRAQGLASGFAPRAILGGWVLTLMLIVLLCLSLSGGRLLLIFLVVLAGSLLLTLFLYRRFGGYTGDLLGFAHESAVLLFLLGGRLWLG